MQVYFTKATYTNNVYKISDFFVGDNYKLDLNKSININFKPNDGLTQFITKQITLPDTTSIWDYTHVTIPEYNKIYKITAIDYINNDQYQIILDEDPLLSEFVTLKSTDLILSRTNDNTLFRGVNDIADLAIKETVSVDSISPDIKTGKWALLFFQYDAGVIGLNFSAPLYGEADYYETSLANIIANYPEITTNNPEEVDYYQKIAKDTAAGVYYQCVHRDSNNTLTWVIYQGINSVYSQHFFDTATSLLPAKINDTDVFTLCVALPFEAELYDSTTGKYYLNYQELVGPTTTNLIDIKIVSDNILSANTITETYNSGTRLFTKKVTFSDEKALLTETYTTSGLTVKTDKVVCAFLGFETDIDISAPYISGSAIARDAEPFYKYDLYVYGNKITIPYYLSDNIHLMIAIDSGVINYTVYYNNRRNILATGSFTHSVKYQIDQLDSFYSQNPTYKDQFFAKMAVDSVKTIGAGAIAGSAVPGLGTVAGAGVGLVGAGVDAGIAYMNFTFMEKGLKLKPDQLFGQTSEVALQVLSIFGIYWVKKTPENLDLMRVEYDHRGFPVSKVTTINDLAYSFGDTYLPNKIVYGELKKVIKNEYVTAFINEKLKQGVILIQ